MITAFITSYGYWAVFVGAVLEGETLLLAAGYAAQQGLLNWEAVVLVAFLGGTLGDQLFFLLGRWKGNELIRRIPAAAHRVDAVHRLLEKYHALVILTIRFLYGLRIAGPMVLGTSRIPFWRFSLFNMVGALIWAIAIAGAGYYFGMALEAVFSDLKHAEHVVLLGMLVAGAVLGLWLHWKSAHWGER